MPMVLLVDANPDSSVRSEKALRAAGYEVSVAPSGSRALAMFRQRRPDLIISQAMFEDMYVSEVCTAVRSDPPTKEIMFVLLVDRTSQMAHATQTQADMVLPENLPVSTVVTRIDTHLRLRGGPGLGPPRVPDPKAATKPGAAGGRPPPPGFSGGHGSDGGDPGRLHRQKDRAARPLLKGRPGGNPV